MSKENELTDAQKRALGIATLVAVAFMAWFLKSYFILAVFAGVMAYLFHPVYKRLLRRNYGENKAAALTLLISIMAVLVPLVLVVIIAVAQLTSLVNDVSSFLQTLDVGTLSSQATESINEFLSKLPGDLSITEQALTDAISSLLQSVGSYLIDALTSFVGGFAGAITTAIIYIYVCFTFMKNGPKLIELIGRISPFGTNISDLYFSRIAAMVRGTVQGQFIIAITQGFLSALTFALIGYGELFFVLFIIFTALSVIPLGAGIVIIPLGILMIISGNVVDGLIVIAEHLLINTNIDNILRPILVPKEARLDSALMIVSVFAGVGMWGFAGIVIGPVLMIIIVTTIRLFLEVYRNYPTTEHKRFWQRSK